MAVRGAALHCSGVVQIVSRELFKLEASLEKGIYMAVNIESGPQSGLSTWRHQSGSVARCARAKSSAPRAGSFLASATGPSSSFTTAASLESTAVAVSSTISFALTGLPGPTLHPRYNPAFYA